MIKLSTILALLLFTIYPVISQESRDISIVEELAKPAADGSTIEVHQDSLMTKQVTLHINAGESQHIVVYRIQVFSDNSQKHAKEEAQKRANEIQSVEPTEEVYITFNSPFWRVRVGNYTTYEEAVIKLRDLKKEFPKYTDMRVVKDNIEKRIY